MSFDEALSQIDELPMTAKLEIPDALSEYTKKKLTRLTTTKVTEIIVSAVDEINRGSTTPLDTLVRNRL